MSVNCGTIVPPHVIEYLKEVEHLSLIVDGRTFLRFVPKETFEVDNGVLTVKAESKLKEVDGLVGLAGTYFNPILLSVSNCREILEAWDWIQKRLGAILEQLSFWLTSHSILKMIVAQQLDMELVAPIELAAKLRKLSGLLNIEVKVRELQTFIEGNVKYWSKRELCSTARQAEDVVRHICNFESEVDLALLAKTHNFEVELAKTPDMYINGVGVDVKDLAWSPNLPAQSYARKIVERGQKAFNQKASLAALSIGFALELLRLKDEKKRAEEQAWCSTLNKGLKLARDDKKPIFLFYHNPWTDDVIAQVDALKDLKEKLALRRNVRILKKVYRLPNPTVRWDGRHRKDSFKIK